MTGPKNRKSGNISEAKLLQLNLNHGEASAHSSDKDIAYIEYEIVVKSP